MFNLPIEDENEELAINYIISYLQNQRTQRIGLGGFTHSLLKNPVFRGFWWSKVRQQWIKDRLVLFVIDYHLDIDDPLLIQHLRTLKITIAVAYRTYGSLQEEIWLVSYKILRYAS